MTGWKCYIVTCVSLYSYNKCVKTPCTGKSIAKTAVFLLTSWKHFPPTPSHSCMHVNPISLYNIFVETLCGKSYFECGKIKFLAFSEVKCKTRKLNTLNPLWFYTVEKEMEWCGVSLTTVYKFIRNRGKSFSGVRISPIKREPSEAFAYGACLPKAQAHQEKVSSSEAKRIEKVLERRENRTFKLERCS